MKEEHEVRETNKGN